MVHGVRGGRCGMLEEDVVGASMVKVRWGEKGCFRGSDTGIRDSEWREVLRWR